MSTSSPIADSGKFSCQKMTFSHTCNLLSQYVKEKRSLSLSSPSVPARGAAAAADGYGNNRATMNLFPITGKIPAGGACGGAEDSNRCIGHSVNLFPHFSGCNHSAVPHAGLGKRGSPEPSAGQMTIFYGGQVMVFNDLSVDKAKEVMDLASSFESSLKKRKVEAPASPKPNPNTITNLNLNPNLNPNVTQNLNVAPSFGSPVIPATMPRAPVANASDLPIARKASLHRFLEKRKDRLIGKAPSSIDIPDAGASNPIEGKSWLGLGSLPVFQSQQQI